MSRLVKSAAYGPVAIALLASVSACGRSENVGWADRELPDSVAQLEAAARAQSQGQTAPAPGSPEAIEQEYNELARQLTSVQMQAMQDSLLADEWSQLVTDVDAQLLANSVFHRGLMERRREIEGIFAEAERTGEPVPPQQASELRRHYQNSELEMARARNQELIKPEFASRYLTFQEHLFDKMRELDPGRRHEIDRMFQLERQLFRAQSTPSSVEGLRPVR